MIATQILATVEAGRLARAADGLATGAYRLNLVEQTEQEIRGFVTNGNGTTYGAVLRDGQPFCSCPDAMYRKALCKHAVILALHVIRNPQPASCVTEAPQEEARPINLKLRKVRPDWSR